MPSPFPGMDPYLEAYWDDVHHRLCTYAADALAELLPGGLVARTERRLVIAAEGESGGAGFSPDALVLTEAGGGDEGDGGGGATTAVLAPAGVTAARPHLVLANDEPVEQPYVNILDAESGGRLVTSLEFISPSNKLAGDGRRQYLKKRDLVRRSGANLAEIDLTRRGPRAKLLPLPARPPRDLGGAAYHARILRAQGRDWYEWYGLPLRDPLPAIRVPLRPDDPDVALALQPLVDQVYARGRYARTLRYAADARPPLRGEDAAWADRLLREAGARADANPDPA